MLTNTLEPRANAWNRAVADPRPEGRRLQLEARAQAATRLRARPHGEAVV